jgi:hypothetical protein
MEDVSSPKTREIPFLYAQGEHSRVRLISLAFHEKK